MKEISLTTDLKQIELEINYHKQIVGQSIWEIGIRLNHVKQNDLAHGDFMRWTKEKLNMTSTQANKFMKVADEFPNSKTTLNIGIEALYLIATLPEEQKKEQLTKAEQGELSTVRELQELKKQLKQKDNQIQSQAEAIETLANREPEIVEKEVIPDDYKELKAKVSNSEYYQEQNEILKSEVKQLEQSYRDLLMQRSEVDKKSEKYDQLSQAINQAEGKLGQTQQMISNYKNLSDLLQKSNEFLSKASSIVYQDLTEVISRDGLAKRELDFLVERLERFLSDLHKITDNKIIEGEIINE